MNINIRPPVFTSVPAGATVNVVTDWLRGMVLELSRWFAEARLQLVDDRLIVKVAILTVGALFTIKPIAYYMELFADAPRTSDATTAITFGAIGQGLVLQNKSAFNLTFVNGAALRLHGAVDYVMGPGSTLTLRWDNNNLEWVELAHSDN